MLDMLHKETFTGLLNEPFHVVQGELPVIDLVLMDVSEYLHTARQESFSLFFRGPSSAFMQQGMYQLQNEKLGDLQLFLVPVGQQGGGYVYQAVFNRLIPAA
jgi:hypothetical protein